MYEQGKGINLKSVYDVIIPSCLFCNVVSMHAPCFIIHFRFSNSLAISGLCVLLCQTFYLNIFASSVKI